MNLLHIAPCACVGNLCETFLPLVFTLFCCYYFWFINLFYASSYLVIPSQYNDFISKMILLLKDASRDKYLKHSNKIFLAFYCGLIGILFDKLHAFSIFCCYQWLILLYTEYLSNENYI